MREAKQAVGMRYAVEAETIFLVDILEKKEMSYGELAFARKSLRFSDSAGNGFGRCFRVAVDGCRDMYCCRPVGCLARTTYRGVTPRT